jgi:hydroxymethylpyrimidine pyrophosphatase-like HAD family hydrolase
VVCSTAAIEPNDARQVERLASLIASWRALGLETVIAAQGGLASIDPLLAALGFGGPLILDLGASLRSGAERRLLRSTPLPPAIVVALLERLAGSPGIRASLHGAEGPIEPRRLRGSTPVRLDLAGDQPAIDGAIAAISEPWWREGAIAVFRTTPELASVVAGGVDKAVGLQRILRGLGLPPSRAFVIAGGEEDLGLLGLCRGMLLGTATARLAAAASITVPRGAWSDVDAAVRHAFAAILSESAPSVHSHASDPAS